VISVSETTFTDVASVPIVTVAPAKKPLPWIVTTVPPELGPEAGVIDATVGAGLTYV